MRRTGAIFLATAAAPLLALWSAAPAGAHEPVFTPNEVRAGTRVTLALLADSDVLNDPITAVEVTAPATFTLDAIDTDAAGWVEEARPSGARFSGPAPRSGNVTLRITGTARRKGITTFDVVTTSAGGVEKRRSGSCLQPDAPLKGAMLFVGIPAVTACEPAADGPPLRSIGLGLVAAGIVLGAGYPVVKRARERSATR